MSFFTEVSTANDIEQSGDYIGRQVLNTGVYEAVIKTAYQHESKSGAKAIHYIFDINGSELEDTVYFTTGSAKGCKNYYESNGKKHFLAGYTTNNDIAQLTTGKEMSSFTSDTKVMEIYNSETKKKEKTKVNIIPELTGKAVKLGIFKENSIYNDRLISKNVINKVFSAKHDKTVAECRAKKESAEFINQWKEKYSSDYISDKTEGKSAGTSSTASSSTQSAVTEDIDFG